MGLLWKPMIRTQMPQELMICDMRPQSFVL
jgi:hypothetical protein